MDLLNNLPPPPYGTTSESSPLNKYSKLALSFLIENYNFAAVWLIEKSTILISLTIPPFPESGDCRVDSISFKVGFTFFL